MRPNPTIPRVRPLNSTPFAYDFFKAPNLESPSKGICRFESCKKRTSPLICPITSSATESEDAAGVLNTLSPFSRA